MSEDKNTEKCKKIYRKPQLVTYGSITTLTQGKGSLNDGIHALGELESTPTPDALLIPNWP